MRRVGFHGGYLGPGEGVLDFSVNVNPFGPPPALHEEASKCIDSLRHYPDPEYRGLREALGGFYEADPSLIIPVHGASEGLFATVTAIRAESIVTISPTYGEEDFRLMASVTGASVTPYIMTQSGDRFRLNENTLLDTVSNQDSPVAVYITDPNNPTGTRISWRTITRVADGVGDRGVVIVDEAYAEIATGEHRLRVPPPNVVIARTLTKYLGAPGLRVGFLYTGDEGLADRIWRVLPPWNVSSLADCVVRSLLEDAESLSTFIRASAKSVQAERNKLTLLLERLDYKVYRSNANYLLLRHDWTTTARLVEYALARGVYLRRADTFWGLNQYYTRVAVRRPEENKVLVEVLEDARLDLG